MTDKLELPRDYREINLWRWLTNCLFDYLCIFGAMIIARKVNHPAVYCVAIIVIGARQHALGILAHDGAHNLVSKNKWVNELLWRALCFWPFFAGPKSYRTFHFKHHKYSTLDDDPEVRNKVHQGDLWNLPVTGKDMAVGFLKDCLLLYLLNINSYKSKETIFPNDKEDIIGVGVFWTFIISLTALTSSWYFLFMWIFSLATSLIAFSRIRVWSEHTGINGTHRYGTTWWRRFFCFPHNTWCHWEHHKYPDVPFYNLPLVHKLDKSQPVLPSFGALVKLFANCDPISGGKSGLILPGIS